MPVTMSLEIVIYACIWLISISSPFVECGIGMNWGRQSITTLVPSMVVDMLLQNQIKDVKLFNSDPNVIMAFVGTDIGVSLTIANEAVLASEESIRDWIDRTIAPYPRVNFRYISVGNNGFGVAKFTRSPLIRYVEKIKVLQRILDELGYGDKIKVVMTHTPSGTLIPNNTMPSKAEFAPEVMEAMMETLRLQKESGAPFIYDTFPIAQLASLKLDFDFAIGDKKSKIVITDENGLRYTNLFDVIHDSFIWALEKVGYGDMRVVVGQVGWPTDGYVSANVETAERYWKVLLPQVTSNRGTPLRPGAPIDIFVHSLTDETSNPSFMPYSRHWGIYWANGNPKYKIDLTGQGRDLSYQYCWDEFHACTLVYFQRGP
jgi:hypothetical protein